MSKEIKKEDSLNKDQHNQDQQERQSLDLFLNNEKKYINSWVFIFTSHHRWR